MMLPIFQYTLKASVRGVRGAPNDAVMRAISDNTAHISAAMAPSQETRTATGDISFDFKPNRDRS